MTTIEAARRRVDLLEGRHVVLKPVGPEDYEWLYRTVTQTDTGVSWRLRGHIPSPDQFMQVLWAENEAAMVILRKESREPVGFVQLFKADFRNGTAHLNAFLVPEFERRSWPVEGFLLFVNYAFASFNLRKVYIESIEPALAAFASVRGTVLQEEGRLVKHEFYFGEWVDYVILALHRETLENLLPAVDDDRND